MPAAEIIAIGTELLLGEIQDTNTKYLARVLRDVGIDLYRTTIVGDNLKRIEQAIQEALERTQIIITTGGLGPTVDDPTREAVAAALNVDTEYHEELWEQIQARFQRFNRQPSSNNKRQAYIPAGATPIENPVGTAPAFLVPVEDRVIISLPGVPREMEYLMANFVIPYLAEHYQLQGTIKARVLHTAGIGESTVDELIGDLETSTNPTVGLLAHPGNTDIRITAKADTIETANEMIAEMEAIIRSRLGIHIFGADEETLEGAVAEMLAPQGWPVVVVESGLDGFLASRLRAVGWPEDKIQIAPEDLQPQESVARLNELSAKHSAPIAMSLTYQKGHESHTLTLYFRTPAGECQLNRTYGGATALGLEWAALTALDTLRRRLLEQDPL